MLVGHVIGLLSADFVYTLLSFSYSSLLYLHSIPCTKSFGFHIYTLNFHAFRVSIYCFFLSNIPWILIHFLLVVFLPACVCDLGTLPPLLSLSLSIRTILFIFSPLLLCALHRKFAFCILAQRLCDICNSMLCVLNFYCHSSWMSSFWFFVQLSGRTSILPKGVFFCILTAKAFGNPRHSRGFSYTKICTSKSV